MLLMGKVDEDLKLDELLVRMNGGQEDLEKKSDVCADEFLLYTSARVQNYKTTSTRSLIG